MIPIDILLSKILATAFFALLFNFFLILLTTIPPFGFPSGLSSTGEKLDRIGSWAGPMVETRRTFSGLGQYELYRVLYIAVKDIITKNPQSKYFDVDHDPLAQVFGPVKKGCVNFMGSDVTIKFIQSTELLRAHITEHKESYIDLENHFSQYKVENDARFENLKDMVASLRSSGCTTTSTERSQISTLLLREETVVHFLNFHEHIVATGRALVLPSLQESEDAEYEVIVDIIFEENSPVFGQRGVFFDKCLIGTKIKYPRILLRFAN
ncbi:hypothetical protein GIB67_020153 [Kingdonia uniflora]|uniref:Uncharacterized protein n=1 Tax=Kingdonia uniflora TaxID=39325 RepID=A0A7J7NIW8_9MAGN|nr:hypothetical protein GIB67_020153 [Kingdonia uniflora]